jgi:Protein of unknown function, DUF488
LLINSSPSLLQIYNISFLSITPIFTESRRNFLFEKNNMKFYRRKILLAILEAFGMKLGNIDIQKLSFIFCTRQSKPSFEYIPYKFGCVSYQVNWDLKALKTYGFVEEEDNKWILKESKKYFELLTEDDQILLNQIKRTFKNYTTDQLIQFTYVKHPYYAINSVKAESLLTPEQYASVQAEKPHSDEKILFTIGYEGISLESYFNKLIKSSVNVLCDVRKNPISQKIGFAKPTLSRVCESLGIQYVHIPELGIEGEKRQNLNCQADYEALFSYYENKCLTKQGIYINKIINLLQDNDRVALTCFEAHECQCHRGRVAKALLNHPDWAFKLIHL